MTVFLIENRAGASGNLGTELVARSVPDGHTLVMAINSHAVNASLYSKLPFDPVKDFVPVILAATTANILLVHPSVPANSVQELIALAKAQPGKLNYASGGSGTTSHLAAELFKTMAGVEMVHVPYKGGGAAYTDLISGQVQLYFVGIPGTVQYLKAGRLRALGVTTPRRSLAAPEVPTIAESGLPGFSATTWWASSHRPARRSRSSPASTPRSRASSRCRRCVPSLMRKGSTRWPARQRVSARSCAARSNSGPGRSSPPAPVRSDMVQHWSQCR